MSDDCETPEPEEKVVVSDGGQIDREVKIEEFKASRANGEALREQARAERAREDLARAKVLADNEAKSRRTVVAIAFSFVLAVTIAFVSTFGYFNIKDQRNDRFRQDCIAKGWNYVVDSYDNNHNGQCLAPGTDTR